MDSNSEKLSAPLLTLKGSKLKKIELFGNKGIINLEFEDNNSKNVLSLVDCLIYRDFGVFGLPVEQILIKSPGHLFREYCIANNIDYNQYHQLEIYPINFLNQDTEEVDFKTFFALCKSVNLIDPQTADEVFW